MKDNTMKAKSTAKGPSPLLTRVCTLETFNITKSQAKEDIIGLTARLTRVAGRQIKCTATEC